MAVPKITKQEVQFASALIHALGGNEASGYLLRAFIAWLRAESGQHYLYNNPLNIRKSPFASGYRKGRVGTFAIFKDLATAGKATAYFLTHNKGFGYERILAAARRSAVGDAAQVLQARDVLAAIGMSKWSADQYGSMRSGHYEERDNRIAGIWYSLTGLPIPKSYFAPPPEKKTTQPKKVAKKVRHQPTPTFHFQQPADFISPYGARDFYEERSHVGNFVLPTDGT